MSEYDASAAEWAADLDAVRQSLDSFWRTHVSTDTADLIRYQCYAAQLLFVNIYQKAQHFRNAQNGRRITGTFVVPWLPVVLFDGQVNDWSYVLFGDPGVEYGDLGLEWGDPGQTRFITATFSSIVGIGGVADAMISPTAYYDQTSFNYDLQTRRLSFEFDPFSAFTVRTQADTGRQFIVLWLRNVEVDLNVITDQLGWVVGLKPSGPAVNQEEAVHALWDIAVRGWTLGRYARGLLGDLGLPVSSGDDQILAVDNDGFSALVIGQDRVYRGPSTATPLWGPGITPKSGEPLFDTVRVYEFPATASLSRTVIAGIVVRVPLSTGRVAELTFGNVDGEWEYQAGRPSEYRFPIAGDPDDIEQFWVDVQARLGATFLGGVGSVNPYFEVVNALLRSRLVVVAIDGDTLPLLNPSSGFHDRAESFRDPSTMLVLSTSLDSVADELTLDTVTSDTVAAMYTEAAPTEVISVSGTDLTYTDLTPLVVNS